MQLTLLIILLLSITFTRLFSQSVSKAFNYFNAGDYTSATEAFRKILSKEPENPAAAFGLGKVFFMKDNKKYNPDSANYYAIKSAEGLKKTWKESDQKVFRKVGYREFTVNELQKSINDEAYRQAEEVDELESWNHFIFTYTTSTQISDAIEKRNVLAFNEAMRNGDYASFDDFLKTYPDAKQVKEAKALYEKQLYTTQTGDSTWQSYKNFMDKYPNSPYLSAAKVNYEKLLFLDITSNSQLQDYLVFIHDYPKNPYVPVAEDSIYSLSTRAHSLDQYLNFISLFPANRNVNKAWEEVYRLENPVYTYSSFKKFSDKYPGFPNKQQLQKDLDLSRRHYIPFQKDSLSGYADSSDMKIKIAPQFTEAAPFSEGMASVQLPCEKATCPYAYVTMESRIIANYPWSEANDFHDGLALTAIGNCENDSCLYGFINRFGEWMIPPQFNDAYEFTEGLSLVKKEKEGYGFIDKTGNMVIPLKYQDASTFREGVACVQVNDTTMLYGYIDKYGKWTIPPKFTNAGSFSESLAPAADEKKIWGYIDHTGNWVISPKFESALPFENGTAKVVVKSKDPKNSKLFIVKEKMIDKKGKVF